VDTRTLGQGLEVSEIGLGCMGMSAWYGPTDDDESVATIRRALELGVTLLDTADMYGARFGENEELVGRAIAGRRDEVVLATKFGIKLVKDGDLLDRTVDGTPAYVHSACDASLERLGTDHLDLYYQHIADPLHLLRLDAANDGDERAGQEKGAEALQFVHHSISVSSWMPATKASDPSTSTGSAPPGASAAA